MANVPQYEFDGKKFTLGILGSKSSPFATALSGKKVLFLDYHNTMDRASISSVVCSWLKAHPDVVPVMLSYVGIASTDRQTEVRMASKGFHFHWAIVYNKSHKASIMSQAEHVGATVLGLVDDQLENLNPVWKKGMPIVLCTAFASASKADDETVAKAYVASSSPRFFFAPVSSQLVSCLDSLLV